MADRRSSRSRRRPKSDLNSPDLIRAVSNHPVIWDYNLPEFHVREKMEAACEEVAKKNYGSTGQQVYLHWKGLVDRRNRHRQETEKLERSGAPAHNKRPFKYAQEMSFLNTVQGDKDLKGETSTESEDDSEGLSDASEERKESFLDLSMERQESAILHRLVRHVSHQGTSDIVPHKIPYSDCDEEVLTKNEGKENTSKRRRTSSLSFVDSDEDKPIEVAKTAKDHCARIRTSSASSAMDVDDPKEPKKTKKTKRDQKMERDRMLQLKRQEISKSLAERVKLLKAEQQEMRRTSKVSSSSAKPAAKTCDCDANSMVAKTLVQELGKLKENDFAGLFGASIAVRLQSLHPSVANALLLKFMELLAAASI